MEHIILMKRSRFDLLIYGKGSFLSKLSRKARLLRAFFLRVKHGAKLLKKRNRDGKPVSEIIKELHREGIAPWGEYYDEQAG